METKTGYQAITSAPPSADWIVMVHGLSQDHQVFNQQMEAFQPDYRLLLVDLPGHGLSADLPGPYDLTSYAHSIAAALTDAQVGQAHFWGTHLGASACLLLACEEPSWVRSLVLEAPVFPGRPLPAVRDLLAKVTDTARTSGLAAARDIWWREGEWFQIMRSRPKECRAAKQRAMIDRFSGRPWQDLDLSSGSLSSVEASLARLRVPVLIVNGEHDLEDFLAAAKALERAISTSSRIIIEDAGGFPLWEFPEPVNNLVRRFIAQCEKD